MNGLPTLSSLEPTQAIPTYSTCHARTVMTPQPHAGRAIAPGRHVQCRSPPEVAAACVDQVEMGIEQPAELVGAALLRGVEDSVDRLLHRGGTIAARLEIAGQELDRRVAAGLADLVDGAAV